MHAYRPRGFNSVWVTLRFPTVAPVPTCPRTLLPHRKWLSNSTCSRSKLVPIRSIPGMHRLALLVKAVVCFFPKDVNNISLPLRTTEVNDIMPSRAKREIHARLIGRKFASSASYEKSHSASLQGKREAAQGRRGSGDEHVMTNAAPIRPARGTWVE